MTTSQLPALRAAGVVDAGGAGLVLLLDSFLHVVEGRPIEAPPAPPLTGVAASARLGARDDLGLEEHEKNDEPTDLRYEVMFFLEAADESIPAFRSVWASYGGSIVIVGGNGLYKCHIHTDEIGGAIEAAIEIGRPREIQVTDLAEQVEEQRWVRDAAASGGQEEPPDEPVTSAVVAVASGEGVKRIFRSLGARQIVSGGQSANPSTEEILAAIARVIGRTSGGVAQQPQRGGRGRASRRPLGQKGAGRTYCGHSRRLCRIVGLRPRSRPRYQRRQHGRRRQARDRGRGGTGLASRRHRGRLSRGG